MDVLWGEQDSNILTNPFIYKGCKQHKKQGSRFCICTANIFKSYIAKIVIIGNFSK